METITESKLYELEARLTKLELIISELSLWEIIEDDGDKIVNK